MAGALLAVVVLAWLPGTPARVRADNLLFNGSFESFTMYGTDAIKGAPLKVGAGWWRFVELGNPYFMSTRDYDNSPWGCHCWVDVQDGDDSQFVFSPDNGAYVAGVYQQVSGLTPGVAYAFSGRVASAGDVRVARKVGMDPTGGTDPRSPNVVWGEEVAGNSSSHYVNLKVTAIAQKAGVTVFIWVSHPPGPPSETFIDASTLDVAPVAHVIPLPPYQPEPRFTVGWVLDSVPSSSTFASYDVQVKDGPNGAWTDWQVGTTATSALFVGEQGHTYYFQVRAMSRAVPWPGNRLLGLYPGGSGQAQTTIGQPPVPASAVKALPAFSSAATFTVTWSATSAMSEVSQYDVQVRDGATGSWTDWLVGAKGTSAAFTGDDGHTYFFRSRAYGRLGQVEAYSDVPDAVSTVDLVAPVVTVGPVAAHQVTTTVGLSWTGSDGVSGVASYDVQTRSVRLADAEDSGWTDWLTTTTMTQTSFVGQDGYLYSFRARGIDQAGNLGAYPAQSSDWATFMLSVQPAPAISVTAASKVLGWPGEVPSYTVAAVRSGEATVTQTPTALVAGVGPTASPASPVPALTPAVGPVNAEADAAVAVNVGVSVVDGAVAILALLAAVALRRWVLPPGRRGRR